MPMPLRTIMIVLWVTSIAGAAVTALLALGWVTWVAFVVSGIVGLGLGFPAGIWTARMIKREDPEWPPHPRHDTRDKPTR